MELKCKSKQWVSEHCRNIAGLWIPKGDCDLRTAVGVTPRMLALLAGKVVTATLKDPDALYNPFDAAYCNAYWIPNWFIDKEG